ncbi:MAG: type II toxin-antitoxin system HicB family antitoxin [Myxococcota bacterium]
MPERWHDYALSREPDGRWLAESLLVPGAAARGASPEEAVSVLREAERAFQRAWPLLAGQARALPLPARP